eukprot:6181380-Pleurochrysis_carterae.AAC.1
MQGKPLKRASAFAPELHVRKQIVRPLSIGGQDAVRARKGRRSRQLGARGTGGMTKAGGEGVGRRHGGRAKRKEEVEGGDSERARRE